MSKGIKSGNSQTGPRDSLMWRVVDYLHANRGEELTRSDIAAKFDVADSSVDTLLAPAVESGHLKRESGGPDGVIWRRPHRLRAKFPMPFTPALQAVGHAQRAARRAAIAVNFDAIVIESGIPIPEPIKRGKLWNKVFDRMKPGDSFRIPVAARDAAAHARQQYRLGGASASFVIRKVNSSEARVWRKD